MGKVRRRDVALGFFSSFVGYLALEEASDAGPFLKETGTVDFQK